MVLKPLERQLYNDDDFEAFLKLPENREHLFELIEGEIVEKMVTVEHGIIAALFATFINLYLFNNPIGWVAVESRHRPAKDKRNDRLPDVSFSLNEHPITTRGAAPYIPELCIEIQSPDDSAKQLADKATFYLANGAKMVWLVYPSKQLVETLTLDDRELLGVEDTIDGGDLLPGFKLPVKQVFPTVQ
ncbi:MAG: Uma2 family endonuclease [Chloroflexi bacterium]|nr:Uma2 family endonuclease [Chloroflexota bacterium]MCC6894731.1 Uma2 family endonuclease [Anaerolineae bacterium]